MPVDVRSHRFISHFPAAQGAKLRRHIRLVRFPHKGQIFAEGSKSDCVYLVLTGRVVLTKKSPGGAAQIIAHKGPDDYFGELGVMDGSVRNMTAVADGPILLGRLPQKPFLQILAVSSWHSVLRLFSEVGENLRSINERYVGEVVRKEKITLVGEMANSMVHDFRGPFSTIKLAAELMARRSRAPETQRLCTMILRQVDRLGGMVEEVLDFARGETRLKIKRSSLQESLSQLQENNLEGLARAGIRLKVKMSKQVLPLDADRFQRVLQNLVTNAREVLAPGKTGTISVSAKRERDVCVITIADTGPGIPPDIRPALFEPFVTQGKSTGTGLGLAICRSIVEAHHGTIDFHTSRRGTTFTIQLPLS